MFFSRIKTTEAMHHLGIASRESFALWCEKVQIHFHQYEFSTRKYLISGEFYAKADEVEINKIKAIHGESWMKFYKHADDVLAYLTIKPQLDKPKLTIYKSKSKDNQDFINSLKK